MSNKHVCIIIEGDESVEQEIYSSLKKVSEQVPEDLSYDALSKRLQRANARTGRARIRLKDKDGKMITIEKKEIL